MEQWIEEVLYRGRPPSGIDSDKSPTFHVVIGMQADDPLTPAGKIRKLIGPMSPQAAAEMGLSLPQLLDGINLEMTKRVSELEAQVAAALPEIPKNVNPA